MSRYEGLLAETTSFRGFNGDAVEAYFARPLGLEQCPAVVVLHHNPGWDDSTKEIARRLAFEGYATISPNLFCRDAPDASADDAAAFNRAQGGLADAQTIGDIVGATAFLRALPYTNGKVGVIGFCSGGRLAYLAACTTDIDASVDAHGGRVVTAPEQITEKMPVAPLDLTKDMSCPLLGLFGEDDTSPSPADMAIIRVELEKYDKPHEFYSYPGAPHGYMDPAQASYRVEAANDSWERILTFYGKHLASS